jgi:type II secretion system protein N
VTLTSRPSVVGQPVTTMFFKSVEVDLAFLPLLAAKAEIGLDIATGGGSMTGSIKMSKTNLAVDFRLKRVPLSTLPGVTDAVGLPLGGGGDGRITLNLPKNDWTKATGKVDLSCNVGCTVGDGVSRVFPKARRESEALMVKDGIPVETVTIARFVLGIVIAKGEAKLQTFEFQSPDGEIAIDFNIKLAKKITDSTITGCIRYKCAGAYLAKAPAACELASPAVDRDGFRNIKLAGKLGAMRRLGSVCEAGGTPDDVFSKDGTDRDRFRPTLDAVAEPPAGAIDAGTTPTPPPIDLGKPPSADDVNRLVDTPGAATGSMGVQPEPMPPQTGDGYKPGDGTRPGENPRIDGTVAPMPPQPPPTMEGNPPPPPVDETK